MKVVVIYFSDYEKSVTPHISVESNTKSNHTEVLRIPPKLIEKILYEQVKKRLNNSSTDEKE